MNIFTLIYHEVLFQPLYNLLVGLTNNLPGHNVGLSIIIVTIIVRLILLPPSLHQAKQMHRNQEKMSGLKKQLKKINHDHKEDKAKKAEATMKLYREAGVNPASGCLPLLIQLPILIALYRVFFVGLGPETWSSLYHFVGAPETASLSLFNINLTTPSLLLGIIAGLGQFMLMKIAAPTPATASTNSDDTAELMRSMQKNMMYIFPIMTVFISLQLPAALALYWVISTLFGIAQQYFLRRFLKLSGTLPAV